MRHDGVRLARLSGMPVTWSTATLQGAGRSFVIGARWATSEEATTPPWRSMICRIEPWPGICWRAARAGASVAHDRRHLGRLDAGGILGRVYRMRSRVSANAVRPSTSTTTATAAATTRTRRCSDQDRQRFTSVPLVGGCRAHTAAGRVMRTGLYLRDLAVT